MSKSHEWDKYIVKIEPSEQDADVKVSSQLVYDPDDKSIRLDLMASETFSVHHHVPLTRKQAIKMIALLEEFVLHNIK